MDKHIYLLLFPILILMIMKLAFNFSSHKETRHPRE